MVLPGALKGNETKKEGARSFSVSEPAIMPEENLFELMRASASLKLEDMRSEEESKGPSAVNFTGKVKSIEQQSEAQIPLNQSLGVIDSVCKIGSSQIETLRS